MALIIERMADFVVLDPQVLGSGPIYDVLVACIQPRPIAFVSTLDKEGRPNLAPFSFFMPGGGTPASLAFSVSLAAGGRRKDTLSNIEATGEFVVNIVTRSMAQGMNATSFTFPHGESEWGAGGFTPMPSDVVKPFRVGESPAQFECRLFKVVDHGVAPGSAIYVIGEIVRMHVSESLWVDGTIGDVRPISRLGGQIYLDTANGERFQMDRPK